MWAGLGSRRLLRHIETADRQREVPGVFLVELGRGAALHRTSGRTFPRKSIEPEKNTSTSLLQDFKTSGLHCFTVKMHFNQNVRHVESKNRLKIQKSDRPRSP